MSTGTAIPLAAAEAIATQLRLFFTTDHYEQWVVAGSVRRRAESVGDIDHVIVPWETMVPGDDLFGTPVPLNLFWRRVDEVVADPSSGVTKALDAAGRPCWGETVRRAMYQGVRHEFYAAKPDNFGAVLAIRTGPGDRTGGFARHLVTVIQRAGYEFKGDGFRVYPVRNSALLEGVALPEPDPVPTPDEETFFRLCRVRLVPPHEREALWAAIQRSEARQQESLMR